MLKISEKFSWMIRWCHGWVSGSSTTTYLKNLLFKYRGKWISIGYKIKIRKTRLTVDNVTRKDLPPHLCSQNFPRHCPRQVDPALRKYWERSTKCFLYASLMLHMPGIYFFNVTFLRSLKISCKRKHGRIRTVDLRCRKCQLCHNLHSCCCSRGAVLVRSPEIFYRIGPCCWRLRWKAATSSCSNDMWQQINNNNKSSERIKPIWSTSVSKYCGQYCKNSNDVITLLALLFVFATTRAIMERMITGFWPQHISAVSSLSVGGKVRTPSP